MVLKQLPGIYKNNKGQIVDAYEIYANTKEIEKGVPADKLELAFLINTDNLDIYSLSVDGIVKEWKKV